IQNQMSDPIEYQRYLNELEHISADVHRSLQVHDRGPCVVFISADERPGPPAVGLNAASLSLINCALSTQSVEEDQVICKVLAGFLKQPVVTLAQYYGLREFAQERER